MNAFELRLSTGSTDYVLSNGLPLVCGNYVAERLGVSGNALPKRIRVLWTFGQKKAGYSRIRRIHADRGFTAKVNGRARGLFPACAEKLPFGRTVYFKIEEV